MSFAHVALEDFPSRLWMLDDAPTLVDSTGFGGTATAKIVEATNLLTGVNAVTLGNTVLANNVSFLNKTWQRVTANTANHGVRWDLGPGVLVDGKTYRATVEVANDGASAVTFSMDIGDGVTGIGTFTLQPSESRRVSIYHARSSYASPYHFVDMSLSAVGASVLFREAMLTEGTTQYQYFTGASTHKKVAYNYAPNPQPTTTNQGNWTGVSPATLVTAPWDTSRSAYKVVPDGLSTPYIFSTTATKGWNLGDTVYVSAMIQLPAGRLFSFDVHRRTGNRYYNNRGNKISATGSPQLVTNTFVLDEMVAPNQIDCALVWTMADGSVPGTAGDEAYMGNVMISDEPLNYFDGGTTDLKYDYAWEGTANNSASYSAEKGYAFEWTGTPGSSPSNMIAPNKKHAALIKGAKHSLLVGNNEKLSIDAPVMKRGREDQAFSVEVTFRPIKKGTSVAQQQIFGTASAMDGLVISGTVLSFTTKYTNTGEARCEFDLQEYRAVTVVAIHTAKKNALYVNGDLVDEVAITDEQQADTYLAAGTSLTSGTTTGTNMLALNGLAIFTHALDERDIDAHYAEAADNMDEFTVAGAYGATVFAINSSNSSPLFEYTYDTEDDWNTGRISGVSVQYGQLTPQAVGTTSIAGAWETVIPLPPDSTLSSITLNWQGEGEIVETSTDANTWTRERRAAKISTITEGFQTNNGSVFLRVSFPGGIENDKSYFDDLVITAYGPITTVMPFLETRSLTLTGGSIEADFDITEYNENWGVEIISGSLSLSGSSATAMAPKTVQVWAKKADASAFSDNLQANATNWYTNDGTYQQEYQMDEWQLRTYMFASGHQLPITFTGTGQIGCILIYDRILTSAEIKETYTAFTGTKTTEFTTSGTIGFVDLSQNVDIYEYDWSIESAG